MTAIRQTITAYTHRGLDPATVVFEVIDANRVYMHHSTLLLRDNRFPYKLTFRWDYAYAAWFWVRGHGTPAR